MSATSHTRLINMFVGLCDDIPEWPSTLRRLGYQVQLVEHTILMGKSAKRVSPDVTVVSKKILHAIVAECKSGNNINADQDRRYRQLESSDLMSHVDVHAPRQLTHVVCYVDSESNHAALARHTSLPFITFGESAATPQGDFGNEKTNRGLENPISLEGMKEPTGYYAFSADDDDDFAAPAILSGLIFYLKKRQRMPTKITDDTVADEVLKITHSYHAAIGRESKNKLKNKIRRIIGASMRNKRFREQISKVENGKRGVNTVQSLLDACDRITPKQGRRHKGLDHFS